MEISLNGGRSALVDPQDYSWLMKWKWNSNTYRDGNTYVRRKETKYSGGKRIQRFVRMHRQIMNAPSGTEVDHINGNGLDNRRNNLRLCTRSENQQNRRKVAGSSKFKGVSWRKDIKKWRAKIRPRRKQISLGCFNTQEAAAMAYNVAAKKYFGKFAKLNPL